MSETYHHKNFSYALSAGGISISVPAKMSDLDKEEATDFLRLVIRQIRRNMNERPGDVIEGQVQKKSVPMSWDNFLRIQKDEDLGEMIVDLMEEGIEREFWEDVLPVDPDRSRVIFTEPDGRVESFEIYVKYRREG